MHPGVNGTIVRKGWYKGEKRETFLDQSTIFGCGLKGKKCGRLGGLVVRRMHWRFIRKRQRNEREGRRDGEGSLGAEI